MHVVQMRKKLEMRIVIPAPKVRACPPPLRGGKHRDQRRRARSTERVLLRRETDN
jgi:hypothetical protein